MVCCSCLCSWTSLRGTSQATPTTPALWVRLPDAETIAAHNYSQTEHRNAEGRTYWYNTSNKESVWEKPDGESYLSIMHGAMLEQNVWWM